MSQFREEVSLAFSTESNSIFIYYLTGTLALIFPIILCITRSLQRKQPVVTELVHDSNISEDLVTFLVIIETSIWPGSGCPSGIKVYMQLVGMNSASQYFLLQSTGSGKAILKRGFTDIFLLKLPGCIRKEACLTFIVAILYLIISLGPISSVRFILSGLDGPLKWGVKLAFVHYRRIRRVQLHHPSTNCTVQIPASIIVTERCEATTHHKVYMAGSERSMIERLFLYHQWLAQFGNTVRHGAFTAVTHVLCVFTSLTALLDFTLIAYILLPAGKYDGEFELVPQSLLIGCICPAFGYCCVLFLIELLLRNIKSRVKSPGNAYDTVYNEKNNLKAQHRKCADNLQHPFMLQEHDFDIPFIWDLNFQTKTRFLSKLLSHVNSEIASVFFGGQDEDADTFLSTHDVKDVSVLSIQIPKYSGVALNHLLCDDSQGNRRGSSLFDLINRDQSFISLQSSMTTPSYLSVTDDSTSNTIVVDLQSDQADADDDHFQSDKKSSQISSLCSVDGNLFWRQYRHKKQASKSRRTADVSNAAAINYENGGESDKRAEDFLEKNPSETDMELDSYGREQITDTPNRLVRKRKHSVKRESVADKDVKRDEPTKVLDICIDLTNVAETNDVHVEIADVDGNEKSIVITPEDLERDYVQEDELYAQKPADGVIENLGVDSLWESLLKSRSRKLVADICRFFRQIRVQIIEGEVIQILPVIVEWFDDVLCSIAMACTVKSTVDYEVAVLNTDIMNIAVYMAGEIIMLTINNVYKSLKSGMMDLPDIAVQSHQVMLAVEETSFSILYAMKSDFSERDQLKNVRSLDAQRYLCHICAEFLKNSFQLIVHANELTWAFFEIYLLKTLRYDIDRNILREVMLYVEENLKSESKETVILQKLCKTVTEEAKCEVWDEYNTDRALFIDIAVKQEILSKITMTRKTLLQRKQNFDREYKLLAKPPKSRLQILAEKRKQDKNETVKKSQSIKTRMTLWEKETGRKDIPRFKELIQHSMLLEKNASTLKLVQDQLDKRWSRLGMKADTNGLMCLAQSLIYSHTERDTSKIQDYLQVKRMESMIREFLQMMLDDLTQYILTSAIDEYSLMAFPDQLELKLSVEDICIRENIMTDLLLQELNTVTDYAMSLELHKMEMDRNLVESTAHLIMRKSSQMLQWTQSVTDQYLTVLAKKSQKSLSMLTKQKDSRKSVIEERINENIEDKSDLELIKPDASVSMETEVHASETSTKDLRIELKLIQTFLESFTKIEKLRSSCTLQGYLERQKQEHSRIANVILHNIIDSYYIIEDGDDSHTFTEAGLYQIEYDVTGESRKKYQPFVKTLVIFCLLIVILLSFVVVTLVGSQFDTTQNQEYLCYYLASVFLFAVVFEPVRALAIAAWCEK